MSLKKGENEKKSKDVGGEWLRFLFKKEKPKIMDIKCVNVNINGKDDEEKRVDLKRDFLDNFANDFVVTQVSVEDYCEVDPIFDGEDFIYNGGDGNEDNKISNNKRERERERENGIGNDDNSEESIEHRAKKLKKTVVQTYNKAFRLHDDHDKINNYANNTPIYKFYVEDGEMEGNDIPKTRDFFTLFTSTNNKKNPSPKVYMKELDEIQRPTIQQINNYDQSKDLYTPTLKSIEVIDNRETLICKTFRDHHDPSNEKIGSFIGFCDYREIVNRVKNDNNICESNFSIFESGEYSSHDLLLRSDVIFDKINDRSFSSDYTSSSSSSMTNDQIYNNETEKNDSVVIDLTNERDETKKLLKQYSQIPDMSYMTSVFPGNSKIMFTPIGNFKNKKKKDKSSPLISEYNLRKDLIDSVSFCDNNILSIDCGKDVDDSISKIDEKIGKMEKINKVADLTTENIIDSSGLGDVRLTKKNDDSSDVRENAKTYQKLYAFGRNKSAHYVGNKFLISQYQKIVNRKSMFSIKPGLSQIPCKKEEFWSFYLPAKKVMDKETHTNIFKKMGSARKFLTHTTLLIHRDDRHFFNYPKNRPPKSISFIKINKNGKGKFDDNGFNSLKGGPLKHKIKRKPRLYINYTDLINTRDFIFYINLRSDLFSLNGDTLIRRSKEGKNNMCDDDIDDDLGFLREVYSYYDKKNDKCDKNDKQNIFVQTTVIKENDEMNSASIELKVKKKKKKEKNDGEKEKNKESVKKKSSCKYYFFKDFCKFMVEDFLLFVKYFGSRKDENILLAIKNIMKIVSKYKVFTKNDRNKFKESVWFLIENIGTEKLIEKTSMLINQDVDSDKRYVLFFFLIFSTYFRFLCDHALFHINKNDFMNLLDNNIRVDRNLKRNKKKSYDDHESILNKIIEYIKKNKNSPASIKLIRSRIIDTLMKKINK